MDTTPRSALDYRHDGQRLVSCGGDGVVKIWNLDDGTSPVAVLTGHEGPLSSVDYSVDGKSMRRQEAIKWSRCGMPS